MAQYGNLTPAQLQEWLSAFDDAQQRRALEFLLQQDTPAFGVADTPYTRGSQYPGPVFGYAPAGVGLTVQEFCADGYNHTTVISLDGVLSVQQAIAGGASLGVGILLYTLPVGIQVINSSFFSVATTQTTGHITANTPDTGLGTVIASGAVAVLDGTATFENISTGVATDDCNGDPLEVAALPTAGTPFIVAVGAAHTVYFNQAFAWSASGDPGALLSGYVVLNWNTLSVAAAT